jgi:glucose-6-phosphate isomerase
LQVEAGVTSGDYLTGFFLGTRSALYEKDRESISVTIPEVNEYYVGMLIALFERAVGLYAHVIGINAYHQPGVEAGKKAAAQVLKIQGEAEAFLKQAKQAVTVEDVASGIGQPDAVETIFKVLRHLAANGRIEIQPGGGIFNDRYSA